MADYLANELIKEENERKRIGREMRHRLQREML